MLTGPVETKVQTTSVMALAGSVGAAVLNAVAAHSELLGTLPALAQFMIIAALPPVITFLTGYASPATPRPDLFQYAGPLHPWLPEPPLTPEPPPPSPAAPAYQDVPFNDQPYSSAQYGEQPNYATNFNMRGRHRA